MLKSSPVTIMEALKFVTEVYPRVGQPCSVLCGFTGTSHIRASDGSFYSTENIRKSSHAVTDDGLLLEINQPKFMFYNATRTI